jgi:hypothetical protein
MATCALMLVSLALGHNAPMSTPTSDRPASGNRTTEMARMTTWRNSSVGIHAFLTFDGSASPEAIAEYADRIDYGASACEKTRAHARTHAPAASLPCAELAPHIAGQHDLQ